MSAVTAHALNSCLSEDAQQNIAATVTRSIQPAKLLAPPGLSARLSRVLRQLFTKSGFEYDLYSPDLTDNFDGGESTAFPANTVFFMFMILVCMYVCFSYLF